MSKPPTGDWKFELDGSIPLTRVRNEIEELTGQVVVNLDTMLDEELELKGTVNTSSGKVGSATEVKLPISLRVNKSFVREVP